VQTATELNYRHGSDIKCGSNYVKTSCKSFMVEMMVTKGQKWKRGVLKSDYLVELWK